MATTANVHQTKWWSGGKSPFNMEYGKLMMWYFLMSDAFTFGAFLISYGSIRFSQNFWPDPNVVFNAFPGAGHANLPLAFVSVAFVSADARSAALVGLNRSATSLVCSFVSGVTWGQQQHRKQMARGVSWRTQKSTAVNRGGQHAHHVSGPVTCICTQPRPHCVLPE
jgi:heme/copper-type cytochrome/quinol oxidase subunit 3